MNILEEKFLGQFFSRIILLERRKMAEELIKKNISIKIKEQVQQSEPKPEERLKGFEPSETDFKDEQIPVPITTGQIVTNTEIDRFLNDDSVKAIELFEGFIRIRKDRGFEE